MIVGSAEATSAEHANRPSLILLPGKDALARRVRDALTAHGERALVIDDALIPESAVPAVVRALHLAGVVAVSARRLPQATVAEVEAFENGAVRVEDGPDDEAILQSLTVVR
jgi:hypothetical protein